MTMFAPQKSVYQLLYLATVFWLFQKNSPLEKIIDRIARLDDETADYSRIRCPLCGWQPQASSRWYCSDAGYPEFFFGGCFTAWNTFDTRGRCLGCNHQWRWTTCLRCDKFSLHEAWYADKTS